MKEVIHHFAKVRVGDAPGLVGGAIKRYNAGDQHKVRPEWNWLHDFPNTEVSAYRDPDCFQIVVAGADSQKSMVVLGGNNSITKKIEE